MKRVNPILRKGRAVPLRARGMALMAVVMMFVLIGVAVVSMTLLFATEVRRTRAAQQGGQLRQLLLAGATAAAEELQTRGDADREVMVKVPLEGAAVRLHLSKRAPDGVSVRITAQWSDGRAAETVEFTREHAGPWEMSAATLRE